MVERHFMFAALALAGCSIIGGGTAQLGVPKKPGHESRPVADAGGAAVPGTKTTVDKDDPPHVARAIERLDKMQQLIGARKFAEYARESRDFNGIFMFHDGWSGEAKRDVMRKRLDELDAAAFKAF